MWSVGAEDDGPIVHSFKSKDDPSAGKLNSSGSYLKLGLNVKSALPYYKKLDIPNVKITGVIPFGSGEIVDIIRINILMKNYDLIMAEIKKTPMEHQKLFSKSQEFSNTITFK